MAVVFYTSEFELFIEKLDAISQTSSWEKWGIVFSVISTLLALTMALLSFYNSLRRNWMKIKSVIPIISPDNNHKINNIVLQIDHLPKTDIKIIFDTAYVKLSNTLILGFKSQNLKNDIIQFKQNFVLIRTYGMNDKKYGSQMTMKELYNEELKYFVAKNDINKIKKGEITVYTNVGYFNKKLSQKEIEDFTNILSQIVEQEKSKQE